MHKSIDNKIGDTGATLLRRALKTNTTLTELNLDGFHKSDEYSQMTLSGIILTGNEITDGINEMISSALKRNKDRKSKKTSESLGMLECFIFQLLFV